MRHRKLSRRFSRTSSHRTAMMRNLAISLIEHEIVKTTVEKGKYLRTFLEPLITKSKKDTLHNRRKVISSLKTEISSGNEMKIKNIHTGTSTVSYTHLKLPTILLV